MRLALSAAAGLLAALAVLPPVAGARNVRFDELVTGRVPPSGVIKLRIADVDGDGRVDAIFNSGSEGLAVARGLGGGRFAGARSVVDGLRFGILDGVGDLDGDGRADVVAGDGDDQAAVLPGRPGERLGAPRILRGVGSVGAVADVDGDRDLDLVSGGEAVRVSRNRGDGTFATRTYRIGQQLTIGGVGDVDGDGDADIAVGAKQDRAIVLRGDGRGGFAAGRPVATKGANTGVVADLNGDGLADAAFAGDRGIVTTLLGRRGQTPGPARRAGSLGGFNEIQAADFDADGRADLLAEGRWGFRNDAVLTLRSGGRQEFAPEVVLPFGGGASPAVGDVDGDGRTDLVVATDTRLVTLFNRGPGPPARPVLAAQRLAISPDLRSARVVVRCAWGAGDCNGTATVTTRAGMLGRTDFLLRPGTSTALDVPLLRGIGRERATVVVRTRWGSASLTGPLAGPDAAQRRRACKPPKSRTIVRTSVFRLFDDGSAARVCRFATGYVRYLAGDYDHVPYRGAGRWLVHQADDYCENDYCNEFFALEDVVRERAIEVGSGIMGRVVLSRRGAIAWTQCVGTDPERACTPEVWRYDRRGTRRLDRPGRPIRALALDASGRRVTWQYGTTRRSADLGPGCSFAGEDACGSFLFPAAVSIVEYD